LDADGAASANIGNSSPGSTVLGSPSAAACATSTGNQTCTITWTAVTGAASYDIWIGDGFGPVNGACGCFVQHNVGNVTSFNLTTLPAGASVANFTNAGLWKLKPAGQLQLVGENISAAPRAEQNVFLPGVLTSAWTGATWTLDKAVTVTRVEVQAKTAPSGCTTNAVVRLTDGTTPINVTIDYPELCRRFGHHCGRADGRGRLRHQPRRRQRRRAISHAVGHDSQARSNSSFRSE
ncbi:MAG: hypothetical protein DMG33_16425, partial [Acidobacteria bacterium]